MKLIDAFDKSDLPTDYYLPKYDRQAMVAHTAEAPQWLHFGAGNIFRAYLAVLADRLLEAGAAQTGIVLCETFDTELIERAYRPYNNIGLCVTLCADGTVQKRIVGSVAQSVTEFDSMQGLFEQPCVAMVSLTITEKGYGVTDPQGSLLPSVVRDIEKLPEPPEHLIGKLVKLLAARFFVGAAPIALVSMDNFFHNGERLRGSVLHIADEAVKAGKLPAAFLEYLRDSGKVTFPCSMIDKITPRPDVKVKAMLEADGFEDAGLFVTEKNTYAAPFVNAEQTEYLVVEDSFPNGRPALEAAGVLFTDRQTVEKAERMKVCTCLNPLHTALAVFGCLLGYTLISDELRDNDLKQLVTRLGYAEGMPVVADPGVLSPQQFLSDVLTLRLTNPFMPDTPQRIACDTSQKIPVRFGETLKAYGAEGCRSLTIIPLVLAGWLRYLVGVDDNGVTFTPSPDPRLAELRQAVDGFAVGKPVKAEQLDTLLRDKTLFGVDLFEIGLAQTVKDLLCELLRGNGAVRGTIRQSLKD